MSIDSRPLIVLQPWRPRTGFGVREPGLLRETSLYKAGWVVKGGASGGPVWTTVRGQPTVVGVVGKEGLGESRGVLLDEFYIKWITAYLNQK